MASIPKPTYTEICNRYRKTTCNKTPHTHSPCSIDYCPLTMCNRVQEREESKLIMFTRASITKDKEDRENKIDHNGKVSIVDITGENGNGNSSSSNSNMVRINKSNEKSELNRMLTAITNVENKNKKSR